MVRSPFASWELGSLWKYFKGVRNTLKENLH